MAEEISPQELLVLQQFFGNEKGKVSQATLKALGELSLRRDTQRSLVDLASKQAAGNEGSLLVVYSFRRMIAGISAESSPARMWEVIKKMDEQYAKMQLVYSNLIGTARVAGIESAKGGEPSIA